MCRHVSSATGDDTNSTLGIEVRHGPTRARCDLLYPPDTESAACRTARSRALPTYAPTWGLPSFDTYGSDAEANAALDLSAAKAGVGVSRQRNQLLRHMTIPSFMFLLLLAPIGCFGPTGPAHYQEYCDTDAPDCGELMCLRRPEDTDEPVFTCTLPCEVVADCPMVCGQRPECVNGLCRDVSCTD
jgi:hypothetical protein